MNVSLLSLLIFSILLIGQPLAFAGTYFAPFETTTPIVSTRGHTEETDTEDGTNPIISLGHTDVDYDTTNNIPGMNGDSPKEIVIYVHGFNSDEEEAVSDFEILRKSLEKNNYFYPVIGFSWDSKTGIFDFDDAKFIATLNGKKLAQFIFDFKCKNPDTEIRLVGHSMGSRVILNTLQALHENQQWTECKCGNGKVASIHVLGAAVDDQEVAKTEGFGESIENIVGEFHNKFSSKDYVLSVLYKIEEGNQALGESGAQDGIDLPENYHQEDVTEEVGNDHLGYISSSKDSDANDPESDGVMDNVTNDWKNQKQQNSLCLKQSSSIPDWIRENARWWADGAIDDESFVLGIQYLIKERILEIPHTKSSISSSNEIPSWIKNNAGWWANGQIDDESFIHGIQFLVKEGIIQV